MVGGEDGTFLFLTQGLISSLSPCFHSPFSTGLSFLEGVLVRAPFYSTDDISVTVYLIYPEELKYLQQLTLLSAAEL